MVAGKSPVRILVAALCATGVMAVAPVAHGATTAELTGQSELLKEVNKARVKRGVPALKLSKVLSRPARQHSAYLARAGKLDHDGVDGKPFYVRLYAAGYSRRKAVGENLGMAGGCSTDLSSTMVDMWLHSPAHKANLLSKRFKYVGIAVVTAADCSNTVFATDFGG